MKRRWWWLLFPLCLQAQENALLEGVVVNQITSVPVKKAQVMVMPVRLTLPSTSPQLFSGPRGSGLPSELTTDASGHFVAMDLAPGIYRVMATHANYPPDFYSGLRAPGEITLRAGEQKRDFALKLSPGAAISGKVTDSEGEPLAQAFVEALRYGYQNGQKMLRVMGFATANEKGEYRIFNLPAGRYYLRVRSDRPIVQPRPLSAAQNQSDSGESYQRQFYPGVADAASAQFVAAPAGDERAGMDFRLPRIRVYTVRAQIAVPEGAGEPGRMQVTLVPNGSGPEDFANVRHGFQQRGSGVFIIANVPPGEYNLRAVATGQNPQLGTYPVVVTDRAPAPVVVEMRSAVTLKGVVEVEGSQAPVDRSVLQIQLQPREGRPHAPAGPKVQADGSFELHGVLPGSYGLMIYGLPGNPFIKSVRLGTQELSPYEPNFPPGVAEPLQITMSTKTGSVEGTVQGLPPEMGQSAMVMLIPEGVRHPPMVQWVTNVDAQGRYHFNGVTPGSYRLLAMPGANDNRMMQNQDLLGGLADRGEAVQVEEGGRVTKQATFLSADAVIEALEKGPQ